MTGDRGHWTVTFPQLLLLLFIGLKLANVIQWSWWWVLAPAWFPLVFVVPAILVMAVFSSLRPNSPNAWKFRRW